MTYEIVKSAKVKDKHIEFSDNAMYVYTLDLKFIEKVELSVNVNSNTSDEVFREIIKEYLDR